MIRLPIIAATVLALTATAEARTANEVRRLLEEARDILTTAGIEAPSDARTFELETPVVEEPEPFGAEQIVPPSIGGVEPNDIFSDPALGEETPPLMEACGLRPPEMDALYQASLNAFAPIDRELALLNERLKVADRRSQLDLDGVTACPADFQAELAEIGAALARIETEPLAAETEELRVCVLSYQARWEVRLREAEEAGDMRLVNGIDQRLDWAAAKRSEVVELASDAELAVSFHQRLTQLHGEIDRVCNIDDLFD